MSSPSPIEKAIYTTVCWFAVSSYPLTVFEIYKWLWSPGQGFSLSDIFLALSESQWLQNRLSYQDGFYTIKQSQQIGQLIKMRRIRYLDACRKFEKLKKIIKYFAWLSGVQAVAAANTLSWWHTNKQSDIDLFIIVKPGTIWLSRLFLVLPFALLRQRPNTGGIGIDPFCFSFFVSKDKLCLETLSIATPDPYLTYWIQSLVPVLDRQCIFDKLVTKNSWVKNYLPNSFLQPLHPCLGQVQTLGIVLAPRLFEGLARRFQMRRFPDRLKKIANQDSRVIVNDQMLKFHVDDERLNYKAKFEELIDTM
ncbi:hypothetical protein ACFLZY_03435 [Patescibacteria group bacterium]